MKLLDKDSKWPGMRHFDSHAYRTRRDEEGVWDFARYSMRSYLILKEKAARWNADPEIQDIVKTLAQLGTVGADAVDASIKYSASTARALKDRTFDVALLRRQGYQYERLDQLTTELLLGVR